MAKFGEDVLPHLAPKMVPSHQLTQPEPDMGGDQVLGWIILLSGSV